MHRFGHSPWLEISPLCKFMVLMMNVVENVGLPLAVRQVFKQKTFISNQGIRMSIDHLTEQSAATPCKPKKENEAALHS